jgi:hypothetical protein
MGATATRTGAPAICFLCSMSRGRLVACSLRTPWRRSRDPGLGSWRHAVKNRCVRRAQPHDHQADVSGEMPDRNFTGTKSRQNPSFKRYSFRAQECWPDQMGVISSSVQEAAAECKQSKPSIMIFCFSN